jgi:hypothetical protein
MIELKNENHAEATKVSTDQARRDFLNKFGKLAVITPVAMSVLMTPSTSAAPKSCRGNGTKRCN